MDHPKDTLKTTRRRFIGRSSAAASLTLSLASGRAVHAAGASENLKLGLVGCGGRGAGAANQAMTADDGVQLFSMADVDRETLDKAHGILDRNQPGRVDVPEERRYGDFEGYKRVIADCDVVILATSPGFRPQHFEEAIARGKHVFMEKPVATDVAGIKRVIEAGKQARARNLKIGVGLQRRHQPGYQEWIQRIQDGAVGDLRTIRALWNGTSRPGKLRAEGETELEYQIRNWYYFTWLSGDHNVEQHVHNLDVANWMMGDGHPVVARGMGGREVRDKIEHGQIYDHHFIEYEYADGTLLYSQSRQIPDCWRSIGESALGTLGRADLGQREFTISGPNEATKRFRQGEDGHQLEHYPFFKAIRENLEYNEAERGALATMTGILGRMATYSGQEVTWDDAMASNQKLVPDDLVDFGSAAPVQPDEDGRYPVAVPGVTDPFEVWY
ncbi:MAG: Gfo/Idh/MocA family oxidoreductase [Verrucomicrobiales bacterium]